MPVPFFTGSRQLSIELAEPVVILRGHSTDSSTTVFRGEVELLLSKPMMASSIVVKFVGKAHMLWPDGFGPKSNKYYHEKIIHEQNIILKTFNEEEGDRMIPSGLHQYPFEFILPNQLIETIEDELGKVYYYVSCTVQRPGMSNMNLKCRRNVLLLRALSWSDQALTSHALSNPSILVEKKLPQCDATIFIEKSMASSGTLFPISLILSAHTKHLFLESVSVIIQERRIYRLPEFEARRAEIHDYKLDIQQIHNLKDEEDDDLIFSLSNDLSDHHDLDMDDMDSYHSDQDDFNHNNNFYNNNIIDAKHLRKTLFTKNAHVPLTATPFQYQFVFQLPNCIHLNHSTTYNEMKFNHYLKINVELSLPEHLLNDLLHHYKNQQHTMTIKPDDQRKGFVRTSIHLDTPITILDCRLKDDYATLPTYEASYHDPMFDSVDVAANDNDGSFFKCPCYLQFKKQCKQSSRPSCRDWLIPTNPVLSSTPPPPYHSFKC
ncbi:unnamed protein product [Cunninghamella blakesleeana]